MSSEATNGNRAVLRGLENHLRWQGTGTDGELLYPMVGRGIRESVLMHTITSLRRAGDLRRQYNLTGMDTRVISKMILIHDYPEFFNGDKSLFAVHQGETKPNELDEIKKLVSEYSLPQEYIDLFMSFENWENTEQHSREAAYARFIDTYDGALMFLANKYIWWFNGNEFPADKVHTDIENVRDRVFIPLRRLAVLYQSGAYEEKNNLFTMVKFVQENLSKHFGEFQEEAFVYFDRDVREIGKSLQSI